MVSSGKYYQAKGKASVYSLILASFFKSVFHLSFFVLPLLNEYTHMELPYQKSIESIYVHVYSWTLFSIPFIYMFILIPAPHCFDHALLLLW